MPEEVVIDHSQNTLSPDTDVDSDGFKLCEVSVDMSQEDYVAKSHKLSEEVTKRNNLVQNRRAIMDAIKQVKGVIDDIVYTLSTGKIKKQLYAKWIYNYEAKTKIQSIKMPDGKILMTNECPLSDSEMQPELF